MSGSQVGSRILISGNIKDADAVERLARAIMSDEVPLYGPFPLETLEDTLDFFERARGGPLELFDDHRGQATFERTKEACELLGVAYVHEVQDENGYRCECHDPTAMESISMIFTYSGRASDPMLPLSAFGNLQGLADSELGKLARRLAQQAERGRAVATAALDIEASAMDEMRTSRLPATERGLL